MLLAERIQTRRLALSVGELTPFRVIFWGSFVFYLVAGAILVLGFHSIVGDAWSRVGNAYYMVFSRDPHLAAIGFVWGPLPSLLVLPLLPFSRIWPDLTAVGFAGSIVSSACMAAAAWELWAAADDWGVGFRTRAAITALFALDPMIVYYAANGMSEAIFLVTLIVAARYLTRWLRDGKSSALVVTGLALGLAYLTRYEAIPAAMGAAALVGVVSALRRAGTRRTRTLAGLADATVLIVPIVAAFVAFAFASLLIVGNAFEQFTSAYGLSSQMAIQGSHFQIQTGQGTGAGYLLHRAAGDRTITCRTLACSSRRVCRRQAAECRCVGRARHARYGRPMVRRRLRHGSNARMATVLNRGHPAQLHACRGHARLVALPSVCLPLFRRSALEIRAGGKSARRHAQLTAAVASVARPFRARPAGTGRVFLRRLLDAHRWATALFVAALAVSVPVGTMTMLDERNNPYEGGEGFLLRPLIHVGSQFGTTSPTGLYDSAKLVATYVDSSGTSRGEVLLDVSSGFPIVLLSRNPTQFVITTDRDFQAAVGFSLGVRRPLPARPRERRVCPSGRALTERTQVCTRAMSWASSSNRSRRGLQLASHRPRSGRRRVTARPRGFRCRSAM